MNKDENNSSFWISYADLMAGLLFVFILLIGAIIVKYSLLQSESKLLEINLKEEKIALEKSKNELEKNKEKLNKKQKRIEEAKNRLEQTNKQNEALKQEIVVLQNIIASKEEDIKSKKEEISKVNRVNKDKNQTIKELFAQIDNKNKELKNTKDRVDELRDRYNNLTTKLEDSIKAKNIATKQLKQTKQEIKNLTGIKIKVISLLKQKLGKKFEIDSQSGAIRLSSNILFDEGEFDLKPNSKEDLKVAVYDYLNTILENKEINKHIDKIIVEGHTNSKGSFLYNMELSQKRAYSVMAFLLKLDFNNKELLRDLIVASGRSYLDPIYNKNGVEDQDKSRRIEIKFRLKNEEAIKEIESILR
ncbi:MAG: OmpA family protein [Campylobacterota bacterium]